MIAPDPEPDYLLQETIVQLLSERPEWRRNINEMVAWETHPPGHAGPYGWEPAEVHTAPSICTSLVSMGILDRAYHSRSASYYRLHSRQDTIDALASIATLHPEEAPIDVADLFRLVIGLQNVKTILTCAIMADDPVHCLLKGEPGSAKTLCLQDIARLPGAHMYAGSAATKSGLTSLLIGARPRFLVIDELDKMAMADYSPLLTLMETGFVYRLHADSRVQEQLMTKVFAACNETTRIDKALRSRFTPLEIPPYSPDDFLVVAEGVLQQREGLGPEMSRLIAREVVKHSLDIRDAVRVARMARKDPRRIDEIVTCLWPRQQYPRIRPIR